MSRNITIIGSGYVGTTTAAILASLGHNVTALDIDEKRVSKINNGQAPFYEEGLEKLIADAVKKETLRATDSYEETIPESDVVISCVGTPDNPDGSPNLQYIFKAAETAAPFLKEEAIYVQKSTVPPGTGVQVIKRVHQSAINSFYYLSSPEFLREGTAIQDTVLFDRVIVGGDNEDAKNTILSLYEEIENNRRKIIELAGLDIDENLINNQVGSYVSTSLNSAELIKVTANAFLALKISFANSIAKLADKADADIVEVMDGVGADTRIGRSFLNAGRGYGGGCFPKDVSGLISSAGEHGVDLNIMTSAQELNESMPGYIVNKTKSRIGGIEGKAFAVLGLAFKPGTSDARKSPAVKIANLLTKAGAKVKAYDPKANEEASQDLLRAVEVKESLESAIQDTDGIFIATDWEEFKEIDFSTLRDSMNESTFVDCMNAFEPSLIKKAGYEYIGVGRN